MTARPPPPRRAPPPLPGSLPEPAAFASSAPAPSAASASRPPPEDDQVLPQTFFVGRYRVVDEIGVGGMASVHLARVDGPGGFQKWVAIKRIHPHLVEDDQFVDMFLDEARIAAGINHANVAQVFDLGKDDNTYWIAMEYLHGEPLREVMRRVEELGTTVPFHIAARVCADAAEGLHGAHELRGRNGQLLNLVHRDVTPHNLFLTYDGYTKVVDFGIAKVVDRLASTRAGTLKGKLAYMSPEQVRGQEIDRRTDVFALGVVLWELTTNRRLFRMDTDLDTLEKVQACVVPLPSTIVPGYPAELEQVVMKALAQRREDRFQTAREFSRALQNSLMRQGIFVAPEDVGDYLKQLFTDRVQKRERYLEWAAEVTGAIDVSQLQAQAEAGASLLQPPAGGASGRSEAPGRSAPPAQAPPAQPPPALARPPVLTSAPASPLASPHDLASSSLMEEDEDIPTQVATEALMPKPDPQPALHSGAAWPPAQPAKPDFESTVAILDPGPSLPPTGHGPYQGYGASHSPAGATHGGGEGYGAQGYGAQPAPPQGGLPPLPPRASMQPPATTRHPQGVIETKVSLPRPAAVADFLVEQGDIAIPTPRSTPITITVALLATLSVIGVGALVMYKLRHQPAPPTTAIPAAVGSAPAPSAASRPGPLPEATSTAEAAEVPPPSRPTAPAAPASSAATTSEASASPAAPAAASGKLTIQCKPGCDSIVVAGRSLGPSPVFGASVPVGSQRVTLKYGAKQKTIVVNVEAGQLTTATPTM